MDHTEIISEKLLQYIWQFQKFNSNSLTVETGESLQIIQIGQLNTNAGPDFLEAKIKINEIIWVGNVEIHQISADWYAHKHEANEAYDNIILHVVWENDQEIIRRNGQKIPTLVLKNIVNQNFLADYQSLITNHFHIPCDNQIQKVNEITKSLMLEKVMIGRLERKAKIILDHLENNQNDWEETTYQIIAKAMGFGLNSLPFERLSKIIPLKIIQKHADNIESIEALLFGAAGFLAKPEDEYAKKLKKEFNFLKAKYQINDSMNHHEWKFMRLRPTNFPTVRIAQLAQILQNTKSLFSYFILFDDVSNLKQMFNTKPNHYWQNHYNFNSQSNGIQNGIGQGSIEILLINTCAPLLVAYSVQKNDQQYIEKALNLLENLKFENNKITRFWQALSFNSKNAFDSQSQIELFNEFCQKKACLACNIGAALLK